MLITNSWVIAQACYQLILTFKLFLIYSLTCDLVLFLSKARSSCFSLHLLAMPLTLLFAFPVFSAWLSHLTLFCSTIGQTVCLLNQSQQEIFSVQRLFHSLNTCPTLLVWSEIREWTAQRSRVELNTPCKIKQAKKQINNETIFCCTYRLVIITEASSSSLWELSRWGPDIHYLEKV